MPETSDSRVKVTEYSCLLGCDAVSLGERVLTFRTILVPRVKHQDYLTLEPFRRRQSVTEAPSEARIIAAPLRTPQMSHGRNSCT